MDEDGKRHEEAVARMRHEIECNPDPAARALLEKLLRAGEVLEIRAGMALAKQRKTLERMARFSKDMRWLPWLIAVAASVAIGLVLAKLHL